MKTEVPTPPCEPVIEMIQGELSSSKRWCYRALLVVVSIFAAALVSLWVTEPGPLPTRLHVAFATLLVICCGWIGVSIWILTRKNCPTAQDRVATAWMANFACLLFLIVAVPIGFVRGDAQVALALASTGATMFIVALVLLRHSLQLQARLQEKLSQLQRAEGGAR